MSGQVQYIGVYSATEAAKVLLASVFAPGSTPNTLDKSLIERHFVDIARLNDHRVAGFTTTVSAGTYMCYVVFDDALNCFLCAAAPQTFSERLAWDVVRAAKHDVLKLSREELEGARALGLNKSLREPFRCLMAQRTTDKLATAQNTVENVKVQMTRNMQQMTENVDNVQDLEARAANLEVTSYQYQTNALRLKRHAQADYIKCVMIIGGVCLLSVTMFLWLVGVFNKEA